MLTVDMMRFLEKVEMTGSPMSDLFRVNTLEVCRVRRRILPVSEPNTLFFFCAIASTQLYDWPSACAAFAILGSAASVKRASCCC